MNDKVQVEIEDKNDIEHPEATDETPENNSQNAKASDDEKEEVGESDDPEARLQAAEQKSQEHYDRLLRLSAEFDNYKKRTMKEKLDLMATAARDTMTALLPVLDDFDRAKTTETSNPS